MVWLTTILVFLGTLITVMLVFCFSQRQRFLAALNGREEHRLETRVPTEVGLELSGPDELYEITITENVSAHGARVLSKRHWSLNDTVFVKLPQEACPSRARITYCEPANGDKFATGLQFSLLVYWLGSPSLHWREIVTYD